MTGLPRQKRKNNEIVEDAATQLAVDTVASTRCGCTRHPGHSHGRPRTVAAKQRVQQMK